MLLLSPSSWLWSTLPHEPVGSLEVTPTCRLVLCLAATLQWFPSVRLGETRGQASYDLTPLPPPLPASLTGQTAFILRSGEAAGQDRGGNRRKQTRVSSRATRQMWTGSAWKNEGLYASGLRDLCQTCAGHRVVTAPGPALLAQWGDIPIIRQRQPRVVRAGMCGGR